MVALLGERLIDVRDRAILDGFRGALRRSELSALDVGDVVETGEGLKIAVARSKTDQEGEGHVVGITYSSNPPTCPVPPAQELDSPAVTKETWAAQLAKHGVARMRVDSPEHLLRMARQLGRPIPSRSGGSLVEELRPRSRDNAHPRSLSALHGMGPFPLHTDGAHHRAPPRFLLFRCVRPGSAHRPTLVADVSAMTATSAERAALRRAVFRIDGGPTRRFLASAWIEDRSDRIHVRYDRGCMSPAHPAFDRAAELLEEALDRCPILRVDWTANDAMVIDNRRCLHGRADAEVDDRDRLLERIAVA